MSIVVATKTFTIGNDKLRLEEVDQEDPCMGCVYEADGNTCPTIKKDAWTGLTCELFGRGLFHFVKD